jgi:hypothetical protein
MSLCVARFVKTSAGRVGAAKIGIAEDLTSPILRISPVFSVKPRFFDKIA